MSDVLALLAARSRRPVLYSHTDHLDAIRHLVDNWESPEIQVVSQEELSAMELLYKGVNHDSASEVWVSKDRRRIKVGDMEPQHLVHALAKILRDARQGYIWYSPGEGLLRLERHATDIDYVLNQRKERYFLSRYGA